uniref:(northern house mosquito) hypothetical protein n=1 Tax=Culex pipiens TaxID=7175 RepID=A0A8D8MB62_CULPI
MSADNSPPHSPHSLRHDTHYSTCIAPSPGQPSQSDKPSRCAKPKRLLAFPGRKSRSVPAGSNCRFDGHTAGSDCNAPVAGRTAPPDGICRGTGVTPAVPSRRLRT